MSCYKLIADGTVVDAVTNPCWVKYNARLNLFLTCTQAKAQGLASHDGTTYWQLDGRDEFGVEGYTTVSLIEITEAAALAIIEALDAGQEVEQEETDPDPDGSVALVRENVLAKLATAYNTVRANGFELELSDGNTYQFSLSADSQSDLYGLLLQINQGATEVDYFTFDGTCITISAEDVTMIVTAAIPFRSYHEAYYHCLQNWVKSLETEAELAAVEYGAVIPDEFVNEYLVKYATILGVSEYAQST